MKRIKRKLLSDSQLSKILGGSNLTLHFYNTREQVRFIFHPGDLIYIKEHWYSSTRHCRVEQCVVFEDPQYNCFEDMYYVRDVDDYSYYTRVLRDDIVNQA